MTDVGKRRFPRMAQENSARLSSEAAPTRRSSSEFVTQWVAALAEHYRQELSELQVALYLKGLADLGNMEVERGCSEALKACRFMPTVADIREGFRKWRQEYLPPSAPQLQEPQLSTAEQAQLAQKILAQLGEKKGG